jgi:hypothetical protein
VTLTFDPKVNKVHLLVMNNPNTKFEVPRLLKLLNRNHLVYGLTRKAKAIYYAKQFTPTSLKGGIIISSK